MVIRSAVSADEWEALASAAFVPVRVDAPTGRFATTLDHRGTHDWAVSAIRGGMGRVSRTRELLDASRDDLALFSIQIRGTSRVHQNGRRAHVSPGDGVVYATRSVYDLAFPEPTELAILQVPTERLGLHSPALATLTARPLRIRNDPALRTVARLVRSLFADRPVIGDTEETLRVSTEILGSVLRRHRGAPAPARSSAALFAAFDRAIHELLDDPRLGVAALARMEGVSLRTVHAVFAERGSTPATHIRAARMRRARALLTTTHLPLADIAERCGMTDASVFSRAFRQDAGTSPGAFRRMTRHPAAGSGWGSGAGSVSTRSR